MRKWKFLSCILLHWWPNCSGVGSRRWLCTFRITVTSCQFWDNLHASMFWHPETNPHFIETLLQQLEGQDSQTPPSPGVSLRQDQQISYHMAHWWVRHGLKAKVPRRRVHRWCKQSMKVNSTLRGSHHNNKRTYIPNLRFHSMMENSRVHGCCHHSPKVIPGR